MKTKQQVLQKKILQDTENVESREKMIPELDKKIGKLEGEVKQIMETAKKMFESQGDKGHEEQKVGENTGQMKGKIVELQLLLEAEIKKNIKEKQEMETKVAELKSGCKEYQQV